MVRLLYYFIFLCFQGTCWYFLYVIFCTYEIKTKALSHNVTNYNIAAALTQSSSAHYSVMVFRHDKF